jgi:hypothetical protein
MLSIHGCQPFFRWYRLVLKSFTFLNKKLKIMRSKATIILVLLLCTLFNATAFAKKWNNVGSGTGFDKQVLCLYVDSANQTLYAGGAFTTVDGVTVNGIAKWNGTSWQAMGSGFTSANAVVYAITKYNNEIYAGGYFTTSGSTTVNNIARWDGSAWQPLGMGMSTTGSYDFVNSLAVLGTELYVGGDFTKAGTLTASNIAKWNGSVWSTIGLYGGQDDRVSTLYVHGGELYAGGYFVISIATSSFQYRINKLTSTGWATVGTKGVGDATAYWNVNSLATYKSKLFVGGNFNVIETGSTANNMAQWDGTAWSVVGTSTAAGVTSTTTDPVRALQVYNGKLYTGGVFTAAGSVTTANIATWNDTAWAAVDSSALNGKVSAMAVFKGDLIIAGDFTSAGGATRGRIAKFNPSTTPVSTTGIQVPQHAVSCIASPNPATEAVSLRLSSVTGLDDINVTIYGLSGNIVDKIHASQSEVVVKRNNLPAGTYLYSVYSNAGLLATGSIVFQ